MSVLGNAVVRLEDPRSVTGGGRFVDDIPVDGAAHLGVRHLSPPCTPERVWRAITAVGSDLPTSPTKGP